MLIGCPIQFLLPPLNISNKYLTLKSKVLIDHYQSTNHLPSHKSLPVIHCFHQPCILELRTELIQWQTDFRGISYFILGHLDTSGQPDKFIGRSMHFEFSLWFMRQVDTTNMASTDSYLDIYTHTQNSYFCKYPYKYTLTNTLEPFTTQNMRQGSTTASYHILTAGRWLKCQFATHYVDPI